MKNPNRLDFSQNPNFQLPSLDLDAQSDSSETLPILEASEKIYRKLAAGAEKVIALEQKLQSSADTLHESVEKRFTDPLTGCLNRAFLDLYKEQIFDPENDHHGLAILFFDLNGLKHVNDTLGHEAGDQLILSASNYLKNTFASTKRQESLDAIANYSLSERQTSDQTQLKNTLNNSPSIVRLGGDEFLVIYPSNERTLTDFFDVFNTLQNTKPSQDYGVSLASGYAIYDAKLDKGSLSNTMSRADFAMYKNKQSMKQRPDYNPRTAAENSSPLSA